MRKKLPILLPLCVLCLLLVWYLWPRSPSDTLPGFSKDAPVTHCAALLIPRDPGSGLSTKQMELAADSQEYQQLMELLTSTRYLRNPTDLVRLGQTSSTQPHPGGLHRHPLVLPGGKHLLHGVLWLPGGDPGRLRLPQLFPPGRARLPN